MMTPEEKHLALNIDRVRAGQRFQRPNLKDRVMIVGVALVPAIITVAVAEPRMLISAAVCMLIVAGFGLLVHLMLNDRGAL
jgi:hypothetical protein